MAAYRIEVQDGTVVSFACALGSVAPIATRLSCLEEWLTGKPLNNETISEAEELVRKGIAPISDIRSTADYRSWVSGRLIHGILLSQLNHGA